MRARFSPAVKMICEPAPMINSVHTIDKGSRGRSKALFRHFGCWSNCAEHRGNVVVKRRRLSKETVAIGFLDHCLIHGFVLD